MVISNNRLCGERHNKSSKIKTIATTYQTRYSSNITIYKETCDKMKDMNGSWGFRHSSNKDLAFRTYHIINLIVGVNKSLEERYIREYVSKINRTKIGLIVVKDIDECVLLISEENRTHYRLESTKENAVGQDQRNSIFDNFEMLENTDNVYKIERSYNMKNNKKHYRYSNLGGGYLYTNFINGSTKELYIDKNWLNNPIDFAKFRTNASCILLFVDIRYLVDNYDKIGVMFNGIKSLCTLDAFNLLHSELWKKYLREFPKKDPESRLFPTPYIHASTDTNNDLRERRITSQIVNKIERTNSIIKITGEHNLTIGIDNTTYSDILPHCEATNKLQSYVKFVKRICRASNAKT